jgi:hypothetical protein
MSSDVGVVAATLAQFAALGWDERGVARKRRLYLAALCRRSWAELPDPTVRAVEAAEAFADGGLPIDALAAAHQSHLQAHAAASMQHGKRWSRTRACLLSSCALAAAEPGGCRLVPVTSRADSPVAATLLREVFGPRSPEGAAFDSRLRTPTVVSLARAAYDERQLPSGELAPHRLSVLADALEEAGAHGELVAHLRSPGPHVRGCWALDLALGLS